MTPRIAIAFAGMVLAALGMFASAPAAPPKSNPAGAARLNNLGCAYMNQQLFEKGLNNFRQAEELDPKLAIARLNEGIALLNLQKIEEAKAALDDALKQEPKNPTASYNLGLLAKNTGEVQTAIDDFKHVAEIDPNDADTWYFLGSVYVQARQFPQAIEAFHRALQINPLHASAEFGLSRALQQSGDADHARENLKKFQYITEHKLGVPISLAYGEQGQYSRAIESQAYVIKPPAQIKVQFVDVTKEAGIVTRGSALQSDSMADYLRPGACFLDFDNDGKIDIYLADNGRQGGMSLYRNLGNGKFEDVTRKTGLDPDSHAIGCTAGDYDNDGFADLVLTYGKEIALLHNEKGLAFHTVADTAGIKSRQRAGFGSVGATFVDYDHDGDLDLYEEEITPARNIDAETPLQIPLNGGVDESEAPAHGDPVNHDDGDPGNRMWRNNGNGSFTDVTRSIALSSPASSTAAIGTDYNNDHAIDIVATGWHGSSAMFENPREGMFVAHGLPSKKGYGWDGTIAVSVLDFDHDGWMDLAFTHWDGGNKAVVSKGYPFVFTNSALTLWRNNHGKSFERIPLPETNWVRAYGVAAVDYDNDGWVDLIAVGETKDGKGEIKLFRNLGPDGFKDVTADVGLDKIHLESPRAIITGDYDNDGAVDLLITQNHGPAVLLKNEGGNQNHWLRLSLKGMADNKSAIGTKVEVFAGGNRQKFEIYGSNGYLGQNSPYLTIGLGDAKEADVVRMLWPTGVLQDETNVAGDRQQDFTEIDRRGSSCPTLFAWNGKRYEFVADMLGAGVVGHWVGPGQRDVPRPVEWIKIDREKIQPKLLSALCHPERSEGPMHLPASCTGPFDKLRTGSSPPKSAAQDDKTLPTANDQRPTTVLSFRFMEPLEEAVYLDQVRLLAVDHPKDTNVYPNEYFASNPPYPEFKVVVSKNAKPPVGAWDDRNHNVLPDLLAHRYFGDFGLTRFLGFAEPHTLTLDLGEPYRGGPLWLLMHGEVEYFSANSMYAASQAGVHAIAPYVEAWVGSENSGRWQRVVDDVGFPAGGPRTMTADLSDKLPQGTQKIRITTNLQIYWNSILVDRAEQGACPKADSSRQKQGARNDKDNEGCRDPAAKMRLTPVPLDRANLQFHGYPLKIEGTPPGNVNYIYEQASATGPYTRPAGIYTRYGDVLPLLKDLDDKLAVFGSGDEVQLDFDPSQLPVLPPGWVRDYFFAANGYEKDMDFYAADGNSVAPLPFLSMKDYPYAPKQSFPLDDAHVNYLLEYNTRFMSGNEQRGYAFQYHGR